MAQFVICHGAYGGGWSWRTVARELEARGHAAFTPTLTGLGERTHLARPEVDLSLHIKDLENVLRFEDLHDVVLVGHSYGGAVVSGVADRLPERVQRIVFIDALIPEDGQAIADLYDAEAVQALRDAAEFWGGGWQVPAPESEREQRWVAQPMRTFLEPIALKNPQAQALPRAFIRCTQRSETFASVQAPIDAAAMRARELGWSYFEIAADHSAQLEQPERVAELILEAAEIAPGRRGQESGPRRASSGGQA